MRVIFSGVLSLLAWLLSSSLGEQVVYEVAESPYEGHIEMVSADAPLVLLIHDWDGLTGYELKRVGMLAEMGYSVFCADLFGAGIRPTTLEDKKQCMGELNADREKICLLMQGALDAAPSMGANVENCVSVGYCFGGTAVLEFARSGAALKGFATFHGGLSLPEGQDYSKIKGKLLIMHGSVDQNISMGPFAALAEDLEEAEVPHEEHNGQFSRAVPANKQNLFDERF